jgi:hypothetical protein
MKIYNKKLFIAGIVLLVIAVGELCIKEFAAAAVFAVATAVVAFFYFKKKPAASENDSEIIVPLSPSEQAAKSFDITKVKPGFTLDETITIDGIKYNRIYIYENQLIVGTEHREDDFELFEGDEVILEREPENAYDSEAVRASVYYAGMKTHIGYMAAKNPKKSMVNDFLERGEIVKAVIDNENRPTMTIAFYR